MSEDEFEQEKRNVTLERLKWVGRRRMAWSALIFWMLITTYVIGFKESNSSKLLEDIYSWVSITSLSVVGAYMGFTSYFSGKKLK